MLVRKLLPFLLLSLELLLLLWLAINLKPASTVYAESVVYSNSKVTNSDKIADLEQTNTALPQTLLVHLPLRFVPNYGQIEPEVSFHVRSLGGNLFFAPREVIFTLPAPGEKREDREGNARNMQNIIDHTTPSPTRKLSIVRLTFGRINPNSTLKGLTALPGRVSFFLGNDPKQWWSNLPTYEAIAYRDLYPGIDLIYRGTDGHLKSEFIVAPGADPDFISMGYSGVDRIWLRSDGALILQTSTGELVEGPLYIYQDIDSVRYEIEGEYVIQDKTVTIKVAAYDSAYPLIIDPELIYSTYLGGSDPSSICCNRDGGSGIAVDSAGNTYVVGTTDSSDFPQRNPLQETFGGGFSDIFVTQIISTSGVYTYGFSTYLGGSGDDFGRAITVDSLGNIYLVGSTSSTDFPERNATQAMYGGGLSDVFVAKIIHANGVYTLDYSTYLGGNSGDRSDGVAVDRSGNISLGGYTSSSNFPTWRAIQGDQGGEDAFITQIISASGVYTYGYSSYLGGSGEEKGTDIAVDSAGNVYMVGFTDSSNFPLWRAIQNDQLDRDVFVTKIISASGVYTYGYSTYLGGNGHDVGYGIAVDNTGNAYVTGNTTSTNFPLRRAIKEIKTGSTDIFVTQIISASGIYSYGYSTYLGGSDFELGNRVAVDRLGNAYITGYTTSTDFPTRQAIQNDSGYTDAFVTQIINASGVYTYGYSTYLGGNIDDVGADIAVDHTGNVYITGPTSSTDFTKEQAIQGNLRGIQDAFIVKLSSSLPPANPESYLPLILKK